MTKTLKTLILFCAVTVMVNGAFAQRPSKEQKIAAIKTGVIKKGATVWLVKPMEAGQTLGNGVTVNPNGTAKSSLGKNITLKNGDCVGKDGRLVGLNENGVDYALVKITKMWVATKIEKPMTLKDGTTISVDGDIKKKDGTKIIIKNDKIFDITGNE